MEEIVLACENDAEDIFLFYKHVCDHQKEDEYGADWHYGIYPADDDLKEHILKNEMHLYKKDGVIVSAMVLTDHSDEMYQDALWPSGLQDHEAGTLHLFAVRSDHRHQGIAEKMMRRTFSYFAKKGIKAVRLDVVKGNVPAEKLYVRCGFKFVEERDVYYEDTGNISVHLYERLTKEIPDET